MNATHFIEVWASKAEGTAKNGLLHEMYNLESCLAKTAELELRTIAIFKIKIK
jgi:hypothetical protein